MTCDPCPSCGVEPTVVTIVRALPDELLLVTIDPCRHRAVLAVWPNHLALGPTLEQQRDTRVLDVSLILALGCLLTLLLAAWWLS